MERVEEEFHPLLFFPDPCSLAVMLGSRFRASGSLSPSGSLCQKEAVGLCRASKLRHHTGVGERHIPVTQSAWRARFSFPPVGSCRASVQEHAVSLPRRRVPTLL